MRGRQHSFQWMGFLLCLLSASTLGLGIADVVINHIDCTNNNNCSQLNNGRVLTWVAVGIWASVPVFVTGLCLLHFGRQAPGKQMSKHSWLSALVFMSTLFFTPALIVISAVEVWQKNQSGPPPMTASAMIQAMFAIPIAIAAIGAVMMLMLVHLLISLCCCSKRMKAEAGQVEKQPQHLATGGCPHHGGAAAAAAAGGAGSDVDRINLWSAYRWMNAGPSCDRNCGVASKPAAASAYYSGVGGGPPTRCFHVNGQAPATSCCGPQTGASIYQYPKPLGSSNCHLARW